MQRLVSACTVTALGPQQCWACEMQGLCTVIGVVAALVLVVPVQEVCAV
jgi:hypothetical protein